MAWKNAWIQTLTDQGFNEMILYLPCAYEIFLQNILDIFEAYNKAVKTCNTAMERKFCQLLEFVQVKKLRWLIKSLDWSK